MVLRGNVHFYGWFFAELRQNGVLQKMSILILCFVSLGVVLIAYAVFMRWQKGMIPWRRSDKSRQTSQENLEDLVQFAQQQKRKGAQQ